MDITRNTLRADGLTVGQALDKDAAFLRSIGIAATDGVLTYDERRDEFRDKMRKNVLEAMDLTAASLREDGPTDADLPAIFRAIDPIADRIFNKTLGL